MNVFTRILLAIGILERHEHFANMRPISIDGEQKLILPKGASFRGNIETDVPVIIAGTFQGSVQTTGGAVMLLNSGTVQDGTISADLVEIYGSVKSSRIEGQDVEIYEGAHVGYQSKVVFDNLQVHKNARISGSYENRNEIKEAELMPQSIPANEEIIPVLSDRATGS